MIRLVFALLISIAVPLTFAADSKTETKAPKKKSAAKKKSEPKASSQDWNRFNSGADKSAQAKKAAKKDSKK